MFDNKRMKHMTLQQFIGRAKQARTHEEWAEFFGISRSRFTEILNGKRPGPRTIQQIDAKTGGRVPPNVWFRDAQQQDGRQ